MASSDWVQFSRVRAVSMCPPAVPLTAVTYIVWEGVITKHMRPVLALVSYLSDEYVRLKEGERDHGDPRLPVSPRHLREEGYCPTMPQKYPEFDYLVHSDEYRVPVLLSEHCDSGNVRTVVVRTASLPVPEEQYREIEAELLEYDRRKTTERSAAAATPKAEG